MNTPVLADYRPAAVDQYHTVAIPLNPSEDPKPSEVAQIVFALFHWLPFAEARLKLIDWTIEDEELPTRRLVGRFRKWPSDPPPDLTHFEVKAQEEKRMADLSKGTA